MTDPKTVLVVEDERIVAKDLQQILVGLGYVVRDTAASADDAIRLASLWRPDLVLMDIRIKGEIDGIDAAGMLRARFDVPIVFLTAYSDDATLDRAKRVEPYGYLLKPVRVDELRGTVEVALFKHAMESRLLERKRWFSTTLCSIGDAVVTVDLGGAVTFMNPAAERLLGVTATHAIGQAAHLIIPVQYVAPERTVGEEIVIDSAGRSIVISSTSAPVLDDGRPTGVVLVLRDVTEQQTNHRRLELADRLSSLAGMANGIAHEINNPLAVVVANVDYVHERLVELANRLENPTLEPELTRAPNSVGAQIAGDRADDLRAPNSVSAQIAGVRADDLRAIVRDVTDAGSDIRAAGERIGRTVSALRRFSKPSMESEHTDLAHCIELAWRTTEHEFRDRAHVIRKVDKLPVVRGDETRLSHVFVNLMRNAAQAIAPGRIESNKVRITATVIGEHVVVEVSDTGVGIAPELKHKVFEPFYTTRAGSGPGLGLSVCQGILNGLGGKLTFDSTVGKGTTFRVQLQPAEVSAEPQKQEHRERSPRRGRILVIDDDAAIRTMVARTLKDHALVCVDDARDALARLNRGETYDVILCDVVMPELSGIELYELLLRHHPEQAKRVAFFTGGGPTENIEAFLQTIPNRIISKPVSGQELRRIILELLGD